MGGDHRLIYGQNTQILLVRSKVLDKNFTCSLVLRSCIKESTHRRLW